MADAPVRIMTYNIRGGLGMDGRRDIGRIAAVINESSPDIVCLQEVHRRLPLSRWRDQVFEIERLTGMSCIFQPTVGIQQMGFGIAVASRLPVNKIVRHRLRGGREPRGVLEVHVAGPGLTVLCTHLGLSDGERKAQAERIAALVRSIDGPVALAGDFNEGSNAAAVRMIVDATGMTDCGPFDGCTYPADDPRARIDLVLVGKGVRAVGSRTVTADGSDHLPVIADVDVGG